MDEVQVHPSVKIPQMVIIGLLTLFGLTALFMQTVMNVTRSGPYVIVGLVYGLLMARSVIQVIILRRTTYVITDDVLRKTFRMFYRRYEREVPLSQLRGVELTQTALQNFFDFGTITVITAGPNRSLGFIEFKHIPDPEIHRDMIQSRAEASHADNSTAGEAHTSSGDSATEPVQQT